MIKCSLDALNENREFNVPLTEPSNVHTKFFIKSLRTVSFNLDKMDKNTILSTLATNHYSYSLTL